MQILFNSSGQMISGFEDEYSDEKGQFTSHANSEHQEVENHKFEKKSQIRENLRILALAVSDLRYSMSVKHVAFPSKIF
jgi:hypothetical protein